MTFLLHVAQWLADPAHWQGDGGIPSRLVEHVEMSGAVMLAAVTIALPLGVLLGHYRVLGEVVVNVFNIGQATPAFGILVIAVPIFGIVATATIAALVAWGGLGRFIVDGLSQRDFVQLFAGAVLVAALSLAAEAFLASLQRLATPAGLRVGRQR